MSIRRRYNRQRERKVALQRLRDDLPILNIDQIRKFRLPYNEAIITGLDEKGCVNSAEFIRQLIIYQEEYRREHMYDISLHSKPMLINAKEELDRLYEGLEAAEYAHFANDSQKELDEFLKLATHYAFNTDTDWLWLAEQFFVQALNLGVHQQSDDGFREAAALYLYGKYLIIHNVNENKGVSLVNISREMSRGKDWCTSSITKKMEKTLFVEACMLLYKVYTQQIKYVLRHDAKMAFRICRFAKEMCVQACLPKADIYFLQGKCEISIGKPHNAIVSFSKACNLYRASGITEHACEARINLALAFLEVGQWERTRSELLEVLHFAESHNLPNFVGQAHLYIGQYNLNQGTPKLATPTLVKALNIFHHNRDTDRMELAKNLAAVSAGQELISQYFKLIKHSGDGDKDRSLNLQKLLLWKDLRRPFWEDMDNIDNDDNDSDTLTLTVGTVGEFSNEFTEGTITQLDSKTSADMDLTTTEKTI